jgi:hypothetical protein
MNEVIFVINRYSKNPIHHTLFDSNLPLLPRNQWITLERKGESINGDVKYVINDIDVRVDIWSEKSTIIYYLMEMN